MAAFNVWNFFAALLLMGSLLTAELDPCANSLTKCVCYDHIGCFNMDPPFNNSHGALPKSPTEIDIKAQVFTRSNINDTQFVDFVNKTMLDESNFEPRLPTKVVIHGFANDIQTEWLYEMKNELLKKGDFNVFIVTWGPGAAFPDYNAAVANSRVAVRMLKLLIDNLLDAGSNPDTLHLIGHSLGAHISGLVGSMLKKENKTVGRISGLDPAEPDFLNYRDIIRLSKDDASFVDVIHTDGQPFRLAIGYGMYRPSGHVDFYFNGGEKQPDCKIPGIMALFSGNADAITTAFACSHTRAHELYLESINSLCPFTAYPCDSYEKFQSGECLSCGQQGCTRAGYSSQRYPARGKFYLNTRSSTPFCGHHYRVTVRLGPNPSNTKGQLQIQLNGTWGTSEWLQTANHLDMTKKLSPFVSNLFYCETRTESDSLGYLQSTNHVIVTGQTIGYVKSIKVKTTGSNVFVQRIELEAGESGLIKKHREIDKDIFLKLCIECVMKTQMRLYDCTADQSLSVDHKIYCRKCHTQAQLNIYNDFHSSCLYVSLFGNQVKLEREKGLAV